MKTEEFKVGDMVMVVRDGVEIGGEIVGVNHTTKKYTIEHCYGVLTATVDEMKPYEMEV